MSKKLIQVVLFIGFAVHGFAESPVHVDPDAKPFKLLSEYHFFMGDGSTQEPNQDVVPYDINTPLFSDYTAKYRFVWMPEEAAAYNDGDSAFAFPVGTALIKTFSYLNDIRDASKGERLLETRLLIHTSEGWEGHVYVWNEEQTDAVYKVAGGTVDVTWTHYDGEPRTNNYIIPNANQCKACHEINKTMQPIGPKARNLNKLFAYHDGEANQLTRWAEVGYLTGAPANPDDAPRLPVWNDPSTGSVAERARAYLDANCMHCHNPNGGPADTTGLDLRYTNTNERLLGINKPPVAAGRASGNLLYDIVPGKPDESILVYRLDSTDPGIMMPELPRRMVDEEGVALIREWIEGLPAGD